MSSHRYWRLRAFETYGGGPLALSEAKLLNVSTPVGSTLTASIAPNNGSVADLYDGSTASEVRWTTPGNLVLHWDLGSAQEVNNIQLGAGQLAAEFPLNLQLQYSDDDSTWTTHDTYAGVTWPGASTLTQASGFAACRYFRLTIVSWVFNGGVNVTGAGDVRLQEMALLVGGTAYPTSAMTSNSAPSPLVASSSGAVTGFGDHEPYKAFDGVVTTSGGNGNQWSSNGSAVKWIQIDLGAGNAIQPDALRLTPDNAITAGSGYYITGFILAGSNTGAFAGEETVLKRVFSQTQAQWANDTPRTWPIYANRIATNLVEGRAQPAPVTRILTPVPPVYGAGRLAFVARGRDDFTNPPLGAGVGRISGTVKEDGSPDVPVSVRVRLIREKDFLPVREMWSDPMTGAYSFDYLDELQKYTVIAFDHTHDSRAVIADNLTPDIIIT